MSTNAKISMEEAIKLLQIYAESLAEHGERKENETD